MHDRCLHQNTWMHFAKRSADPLHVMRETFFGTVGEQHRNANRGTCSSEAKGANEEVSARDYQGGIFLHGHHRSPSCTAPIRLGYRPLAASSSLQPNDGSLSAPSSSSTSGSLPSCSSPSRSSELPSDQAS